MWTSERPVSEFQLPTCSPMLSPVISIWWLVRLNLVFQHECLKLILDFTHLFNSSLDGDIIVRRMKLHKRLTSSSSTTHVYPRYCNCYFISWWCYSFFIILIIYQIFLRTNCALTPTRFKNSFQLPRYPIPSLRTPIYIPLPPTSSQDSTFTWSSPPCKPHCSAVLPKRSPRITKQHMN